MEIISMHPVKLSEKAWAIHAEFISWGRTCRGQLEPPLATKKDCLARIKEIRAS